MVSFFYNLFLPASTPGHAPVIHVILVVISLKLGSENWENLFYWRSGKASISPHFQFKSGLWMWKKISFLIKIHLGLNTFPSPSTLQTRHALGSSPCLCTVQLRCSCSLPKWLCKDRILLNYLSQTIISGYTVIISLALGKILFIHFRLHLNLCFFSLHAVCILNTFFLLLLFFYFMASINVLW